MMKLVKQFTHNASLQLVLMHALLIAFLTISMVVSLPNPL